MTEHIFYHATQEIKPFTQNTLKPWVVSASDRHGAIETRAPAAPLKHPLQLDVEPHYHGKQRPGIFVFTKKDMAARHIGPDSKETFFNAQGGMPMVVGIKADSLTDWRPDYEMHAYAMLKVIKLFLSTDGLQRLTGKSVKLHGHQVTIKKITERGIAFLDEERGNVQKFLSFTGMDDNNDIGIARYMQALCDIVEREYPACF